MNSRTTEYRTEGSVAWVCRLACLAVCVSWSHVAALAAQPAPAIQVALRFDDYSTKSHTETEMRLIAVLKEYGAACTFGVVPFVCAGDNLDPAEQDMLPLSQEKADLLRSAIDDGTIEIAVHGYTHQRLPYYTPRGTRSEFYGVPLGEQRRMLAEAKEFLEMSFATRVTCFIPPFNSCDGNTITALDDLGYQVLSANMIGIRDEPEQTAIRFLPQTCELLDLKDAIAGARDVADPDAVIVVVMHEYDFIECDQPRGKFTFDEFAEILRWTSSQPDVEITTFGRLAQSGLDLGVERLRANSIMPYPKCLLPEFMIPKPESWHVYLSPSTAVSLRRNQLWAMTIVLYTLVIVTTGAISLLFVTVLSKKLPLPTPVIIAGGFLLIGIQVVRASRDWILDCSEGIVLGILVGATIGATMRFWSQRKRGRQPEESAVQSSAPTPIA